METRSRKSPSKISCGEDNSNKEISPNQPSSPRKSLRRPSGEEEGCGLGNNVESRNLFSAGLFGVDKNDKSMQKRMKFWTKQFDDLKCEKTGGPSYRVLSKTDPARVVSKHRGNVAKSVLNDEFVFKSKPPSKEEAYPNRSECIIREADDLQYEFDMTIEILSSTLRRLHEFIDILHGANGNHTNLPPAKEFFNVVHQKCIERLYGEKKEKEEKKKKQEERKKKKVINNELVVRQEIPVHFVEILNEIPLHEVLVELLEKEEQERMAKENRTKKFAKLYEKYRDASWKYCDSFGVPK